MNDSTLAIETATPADAEWIARAQIEMARETESLALDPPAVARGVRHVFDNPQIGFYLIATDANGARAGCLLILYEWSDWRGAWVWWIHSVYVAPEFRRRKVWSAMFERAEALARAAKARGLRLYVDKTNTPAQTAYVKAGMNGDHYQLFEKMF